MCWLFFFSCHFLLNSHIFRSMHRFNIKYWISNVENVLQSILHFPKLQVWKIIIRNSIFFLWYSNPEIRPHWQVIWMQILLRTFFSVQSAYTKFDSRRHDVHQTWKMIAVFEDCIHRSMLFAIQSELQIFRISHQHFWPDHILHSIFIWQLSILKMELQNQSCQWCNIREAEWLVCAKYTKSHYHINVWSFWFDLKKDKILHPMPEYFFTSWAPVRQSNGSSFVEFIASHFHKIRDFIQADIGKC